MPRFAAIARSVALTSALLLGVVHSPSVHAAPTASEKDTARALMKDGREKRAAGDHKGALEAFRGADALMKVPTTGLEVGKSEIDLGLLVEARDTLLGVARIPVEKGEPVPFAEARKEADALATQLEPRIPTLKLILTNVPDGAKPVVKIDDHEVPAAAVNLPQRLNPGKHLVMVTVGSAKKKRTVELKESAKSELRIDLSDDSAAEETVVATPTPTPVKGDVPSGKSVSTLTWIGFGVGGAGLLAGGITGILAYSKSSSIKEQCLGTECPHSVHDDLVSARRMATISNISFAVGALGLGLGVIGLLTSGPSSPEPAPTAQAYPRVTMGLGLGSLVVFGNF